MQGVFGMQCQICKKIEATVHLTEIVDGVRSEMHMCEHCAQNEGVVVKSQVPINELLGNLLASQPMDEESFGASTAKDEVCPYCGFTIQQYRKDGLLGCPHDYNVFEKQLSLLVEKTQDGKTVHRGKVPSKAPQQAAVQTHIADLQKQLEAAVKSENYELAAKLRDRIVEAERQ